MLRKPALVERVTDPRHLEELERCHSRLAILHEAAPVITSAGLRVSVRPLPSGPLDVLWSHEHLREHDAHVLV